MRKLLVALSMFSLALAATAYAEDYLQFWDSYTDTNNVVISDHTADYNNLGYNYIRLNALQGVNMSRINGNKYSITVGSGQYNYPNAYLNLGWCSGGNKTVINYSTDILGSGNGSGVRVLFRGNHVGGDAVGASCNGYAIMCGAGTPNSRIQLCGVTLNAFRVLKTYTFASDLGTTTLAVSIVDENNLLSVYCDIGVNTATSLRFTYFTTLNSGNSEVAFYGSESSTSERTIDNFRVYDNVPEPTATPTNTATPVNTPTSTSTPVPYYSYGPFYDPMATTPTARYSTIRAPSLPPSKNIMQVRLQSDASTRTVYAFDKDAYTVQFTPGVPVDCSGDTLEVVTWYDQVGSLDMTWYRSSTIYAKPALVLNYKNGYPAIPVTEKNYLLGPSALSNFITASEGTMAISIKSTGTPNQPPSPYAWNEAPGNFYSGIQPSHNLSKTIMARAINTSVGDVYTYSFAAVLMNVWNHLVWLHTGGGLTLYAGAVAVGTPTTSGDSSRLTDAFQVMGDSTGTRYVQSVTFYNKGLSQDWITDLYQYDDLGPVTCTPTTTVTPDWTATPTVTPTPVPTPSASGETHQRRKWWFYRWHW